MGAFHFLGFSFLILILILILLLICTQEGDGIKIKIRSKIKRGTQKCECTQGMKGDGGFLPKAATWRRGLAPVQRQTEHFQELVIDRLLAEEAISCSRMLAFGDGPVEIQETKRTGGVAVAVAGDEENNGSGRPDPCKREQLLQAGADAVTADFQAADGLLKMIFGS